MKSFEDSLMKQLEIMIKELGVIFFFLFFFQLKSGKMRHDSSPPQIDCFLRLYGPENETIYMRNLIIKNR